MKDKRHLTWTDRGHGCALGSHCLLPRGRAICADPLYGGARLLPSVRFACRGFPDQIDP